MITANQLKIGQSVQYIKCIFRGTNNEYILSDVYYTGIIKQIHGNLLIIHDHEDSIDVISTVEEASFHERRKAERRQDD